jgi:hypothetical protein
METRPNTQSNVRLQTADAVLQSYYYVLLALCGDGHGLDYLLSTKTRPTYVAMVTIQRFYNA